MKFNEFLKKLNSIKDKFDSFDISYLSIDAKKDDESIRFSGNTGEMFDCDNEAPITHIKVEHEVTYEKPIEVETIGDLKEILDKIDDNFKVIDVCLFAQSKKEDIKGVGFKKTLFTTRENNKLTEEMRYNI